MSVAASSLASKSAPGLLLDLAGDISGEKIIEYGPDGPCPWEREWEEWLTELFPDKLTSDFAQCHRNLWRWVWSIHGSPLFQCQPFLALWPRGYGKSSSGELAVIALGARCTRNYVLYVSGTQAAADKHVEDIGSSLESPLIAKWYPALGRRRVGKYGYSRGWGGNRLVTDQGLVVESIGLDTTIRGAKVEGERPGLIVLDDIDSLEDQYSPDDQAVKKKISRITRSILPSGARNYAVLFLQNLIYEDSIASRLAGVSDLKVDFLSNAIIDGPHKAIDDLEYRKDGNRTVITGGRSSWPGFTLEMCQNEIDKSGIEAFLSESQHEFKPAADSLYGDVVFQHCQPGEIPLLEKIAVWVDPSVTDTKKSDSVGISCGGMGVDGKLYVLWSWENRCDPDYAMRLALATALEYGASTLGVETNQGGLLWRQSYERLVQELKEDRFTLDKKLVKLRPGIPGRPYVPAVPGLKPAIPAIPPTPGQSIPKFDYAHPSGANESKVDRQQRVVFWYKQGLIVHVWGTHEVLERSLRRFGVKKPFDLADANYHLWYDLAVGKRSMKYA